jgi:hypothetical protein
MAMYLNNHCSRLRTPPLLGVFFKVVPAPLSETDIMPKGLSTGSSIPPLPEALGKSLGWSLG